MTAHIPLPPHAFCVPEEVVALHRGPETKEGREGGRDREMEIDGERDSQLFPWGSVAMATEAFPARRGTNTDERVRGGRVGVVRGGGGC